MTTLTIELDRDLWSIPSGGAITHVINIDDPAASMRDLVITGARSLELDLAPGRYLVRTEMPSGELRMDEIDLDQGAKAILAIDAPRSDHEWLQAAAWYGMPQRTVQREAFDLSRTFEIDPATEVEVSAVDHLPWNLDIGHLGWRATSPSQQDRYAAIFSDISQGAPRSLVRFTEPRRSFIVAVPGGWETRSGSAPVQVVITHDGPHVVIADDLVTSILAYLAHGNLPAAARLGSSLQQRDLLFQKQLNPVRAAAGGYALLSALESAEPRDWFSWVENLANWFDWLPDGAILLARLKLLTATGDRDLETALQALDTAWERGLPFFSLGVTWMLEMMEARLADDDTGENRHRVELIRARASQLHPGQAILSLQVRQEPD